MDHFQPSLARSTGLLAVPSPPQGALWIDPSTDTSDKSRPTMRSWARSASGSGPSKTPASTHSSRRARIVVSDTRPPNSLSAVTHEQPVTNRIKIPQNTILSGIRRRCPPVGWLSTGTGTSGSIAAHTGSTTSDPNARMMCLTSTVVSLTGHPTFQSGQPDDPRMVNPRGLLAGCLQDQGGCSRARQLCMVTTRISRRLGCRGASLPQ